MEKVQLVVKDAGTAFRKFFSFKTRREDFSYGPMNSGLALVREVSVSSMQVGAKRFARYDYEPVRRARARV